MSSTNPGPATTTTNVSQSPFSNVQQLAIIPFSGGTLSAVSANTTSTQTVTITGLATTDVVLEVSKPTNQVGLAVASGFVSAANTLSITFVNATTASITPTASETYQLVIARPAKASVTSMPII